MLFSTHVNHVSVCPINGIGPTQGQRKTLTAGAALPTELQGQMGAGCGNLRCQFHGNEYVHVVYIGGK